MIDALIMAGGESTRMRETYGPTHKSLIPISGVTLLERNVAHLLHHGFRRIYLAVNSTEWKLREYIEDVVHPFVTRHSASLTCLVETKPLGTIGIAKTVPGDDALAVVNVDNLSTIDLREMIHHHVATKAALSIATHDEPFQIPFGQLVTNSHDVIENYLEKPVIPVSVSSGTYVLGPAAKNSIEPDVRTDINHLFETLKTSNQTVVAYRHQALWIDVNDREAVEKADRLLTQNQSLFTFPEAQPHSAPLG